MYPRHGSFVQFQRDMLQHHFTRTTINGFTPAHTIFSHPQFYYIPERELAYLMDDINEQNVTFRPELVECPMLTKEDLILYDKVIAFNIKHFP